MTAPADHQARMREIEARLATQEFYLLADIEEAEYDLRYLLDRVRVQSERIKALEEVVANWRRWDRDDYAVCRFCDQYDDSGHRPDCIVLTLPAPETVETQG